MKVVARGRQLEEAGLEASSLGYEVGLPVDRASTHVRRLHWVPLPEVRSQPPYNNDLRPVKRMMRCHNEYLTEHGPERRSCSCWPPCARTARMDIRTDALSSPWSRP
jgi:hypothetical protein